MIDITVNDLPFSVNDVTPAASRVSRIVGRKIRLMKERSYRTAIKQPRKIVRDELLHIYAICHRPNWDGYDASPVTFDTLVAAANFFQRLPDSANVPEVTADPDGDMAFEWHNDNNSLSVAVNSLGQIAYAGCFGNNATMHGSEGISDSAIETIYRLIDRVYRDKDSRPIA